ncbi:MAG: PEP-CTERM sorting domain-containing protein [Pirellulales bacterium]
MYRTCSRLAAVVLTLSLQTSLSYAIGEYTFDGGGDGTSWDDPANWKVTLFPDETPGDGSDPATPPNPITAARIPLSGVVIDSSMPGQTAFDVHVGTALGNGSLSISGGDLASGDDIELGVGGGIGTMDMSGGTASTGDDFNIGAGSSLHMSGGSIHLGDRLQMSATSSLVMDGGEIIADDDFYVLGTSTVTMNGGLMSTIDKLNMGGDTPSGPARLIINGGIMRSNEWTDNPDLEQSDPTRFMSYIQINGSGKLQVEQATLPIVEAQGLVTSGRIATIGALPLAVSTVIVPEYFGRTDVVFTQVSVVPEPATALLLGFGGLIALAWRKRS